MKRLVLVTGASAGIGTALARAYAKRGFDVALTARRAGRLETLAQELRRAWKVEAIVAPADLAKLETPAALLARIGRPVDVLVNNAGYGFEGGFADGPWQKQADFLQVMLNAPTELAHRVLPGMRERGYGRILNVASLSGLIPPGRGLYGPIKAYLVRFSVALRGELKGTGVHVTALCPGLTYSEFHDVAGSRQSFSRIPGLFWKQAEPVAEAGVKACEKNQAIIVTGAPNKIIRQVARLL